MCVSVSSTTCIAGCIEHILKKVMSCQPFSTFTFCFFLQREGWILEKHPRGDRVMRVQENDSTHLLRNAIAVRETLSREASDIDSCLDFNLVKWRWKSRGSTPCLQRRSHVARIQDFGQLRTPSCVPDDGRERSVRKNYVWKLANCDANNVTKDRSSIRSMEMDHRPWASVFGNVSSPIRIAKLVLSRDTTSPPNRRSQNHSIGNVRMSSRPFAHLVQTSSPFQTDAFSKTCTMERPKWLAKQWWFTLETQDLIAMLQNSKESRSCSIVIVSKSGWCDAPFSWRRWDRSLSKKDRDKTWRKSFVFRDVQWLSFFPSVIMIIERLCRFAKSREHSARSQ